jgi:hypothetical protein
MEIPTKDRGLVGKRVMLSGLTCSQSRFLFSWELATLFAWELSLPRQR